VRFFSGTSGYHNHNLYRVNNRLLGFSTTYNTAGTAILRRSRARHRILWVGLWVEKDSQTSTFPGLRSPLPKFLCA